MGSNQHVRLIDIANELGCTVNTVSRALRDKPDIGQEMKMKIKKVAEALGYIPNSIATSLRSGLSHTVAIVFDNMINPYFMIMADKIHKQLESLGYATMIFAAPNGRFRIDALNPIITRKVDGIITFLEPDHEVLTICQKSNIPMILVGRRNTTMNIDSVSTNDYQGGYEVGSLLVKNGAKNIGYIGAPIEIECSVRRLNGLKKSLDDHHTPYKDDNLRYMTTYRVEDDLEVLLKNKVDAIFFFNDVMALEAISILSNKGIKVPEQLQIVGYDNIQSEFFLPIRLTTVESDKDLIVSSVIDMIIDKMQNTQNKKNQHIDFDVTIKLGNTT